MPISVLRRLVNKSLGGQAVADDYALHVGTVRECGSRNRDPRQCKRNWSGVMRKPYISCAMRHIPRKSLPTGKRMKRSAASLGLFGLR